MPNRSWIRPDDAGGWTALTDPQRSDEIGASGESVMDGDVIAGVVNGVIPSIYRGRPDRFELTDDWRNLDRWLDLEDASKVRVYQIDMKKFDLPSIDGINHSGIDVTDQFDVTVSDTTVKATAKPEYLDLLGKRKTAMQFSMLIPFTVDFDLNADLEREFGSIGQAWESDGLNTCGTGKGGMLWEDQTLWETNEPSLCIIRPALLKTVTSTRSDGEARDVNGMNILVGQSLTYTLRLRIGKGTKYTLGGLSFSDEYSTHVEPSRDSLTLGMGDEILSQDIYDVHWDDAAHRVTVTMTPEWNAEWKHDEDHCITLSFNATVTQDVEAGTVISNNAVATVNGSSSSSNTVTNTVVQPGEPVKDVTVGVGSDSADGMSLYQGQAFLYRLDSSTLPANRAYPTVDEWRIDDDYDETADRYAGQWAVYAASDLHAEDGTTIAAKGARIAGSGFDSTALGGDLFTLEMRDDSFSVMATRRYLDIIAVDGTHEHGWRAYVRFIRIRAGEVSNTFTQILDGREHQSNTVTTSTPERSPSIRVDSFDEAGGIEKGDRDTPEDALALTDERTTLVFRITNTGDVPLTALDLSTEIVAGDGEIADWKYPDGWRTLVLQPGEYTDVTGTLAGVTVLHTNRAVATAAPVIVCAPDDDPFNVTPSGGGENAICTDTAVDSAPDDWNGYTPQTELPNTGSSFTMAMTLGLGLLLVGMGLLFLVLSRSHEERRQFDAAVA